MSILGKCSSCGGNVEYSPELGCLKCTRCSRETEIETIGDIEVRDIDPVATKDIKIRQSGVLKCLSCGASFQGGTSNMSAECVYCGANIIEEMDVDRGLVPNAIIPFEISKDKARQILNSWIKDDFYSPRDFKKSNRNIEIESVYVPVFEYDYECQTKYNGRLYEYDRDSDGDSVRRTRSVSGVIDTNNLVIYECSNYVTQLDFDRIKPYKTDKLRKFDKRYVMGYSVEHPNTDVMEVRDKTKVTLDSQINNAIVRYYRYDGYDYMNKEITYKRIGFKYVLYPIYKIKINYKQKTSYVYMNGQTGKKSGMLPKSGLKIALTILLSLGAVGIIVAIFILMSRGL